MTPKISQSQLSVMLKLPLCMEADNNDKKGAKGLTTQWQSPLAESATAQGSNSGWCTMHLRYFIKKKERNYNTPSAMDPWASESMAVRWLGLGFGPRGLEIERDWAWIWTKDRERERERGREREVNIVELSHGSRLGT
jgi:hypothetical protein